MNSEHVPAFRKRFVLALAVSLSVHALLFWLPPIQLPEPEPDLPPLIAELVPLPSVHTSAKPKARPPRQPSLPPVAAPSIPTNAASAVAAASSPEAATPAAASAVAVTEPADQDIKEAIIQAAAASSISPASTIGDSQAIDTASSPQPASAVAAAPPRPMLPKHAFLKFQVRIGKDGMAVADARHELKIEDGRYTLTATTRTIGLARLVKSYKLVQTSSGETDGIVLHPERYSEDKKNDGEARKDSVILDYASGELRFASGRKMPLEETTQDILSILYQFPPLPEQGDVLPIAITNGKDWEKYNFEIVTNEELITPMGKLHTVHFRKQHPPGKEGLEIWFAQEYRLLPVKLRHIERDGSIAGEAVITDIRIAEK